MHCRVPILRRRCHAVEFVDLAKMADRLRITTVHSKNELSVAGEHTHEPVSVGGNVTGSQGTAPTRCVSGLDDISYANRM
jgi:hypothetical protein